MAIDPKDLAIHDEIVVETEIDGVSVGLSAFVTNVLADELWLATRLPEPRLLSVAEGQRIHLSFDRNGALIVESVFLRRLGSLGTEKIGTGRTVNIGAGGVQFTTVMPLLFGEQLRLALVLTSRDIVVAGGVIVRIEDGDPPPAAAAATTGKAAVAQSKVAVRFDKISEVDQERITCHILSAHRQRAKEPAELQSQVRVAPSSPAPPQTAEPVPDEAAGPPT
jgi:hypothetical protein